MQDGGKYERIQQHSAPELQFCCTCMMTIKGYSTVFYNLRGVLFVVLFLKLWVRKINVKTFSHKVNKIDVCYVLLADWAYLLILPGSRVSGDPQLMLMRDRLSSLTRLTSRVALWGKATGLGSVCSCMISSGHLSLNFLILPHIRIASHCGVNVHLVLSHLRCGGWWVAACFLKMWGIAVHLRFGHEILGRV